MIKEKLDGSKYPELVLMTPPDREEQKSYHLTLTALDFGDPTPEQYCTDTSPGN